MINAIEHDDLFMADLDRPVHGVINTEAAIAQAVYEVLMGIYASHRFGRCCNHHLGGEIHLRSLAPRDGRLTPLK
jgi:hypothetical protein